MRSLTRGARPLARTPVERRRWPARWAPTSGRRRSARSIWGDETPAAPVDERLMRVVLEKPARQRWKFSAKKEAPRRRVPRRPRGRRCARGRRNDRAPDAVRRAALPAFSAAHRGGVPGTGVGIATVQASRPPRRRIWAEREPGRAHLQVTLPGEPTSSKRTARPSAGVGGRQSTGADSKYARASLADRNVPKVRFGTASLHATKSWATPTNGRSRGGRDRGERGRAAGALSGQLKDDGGGRRRDGRGRRSTWSFADADGRPRRARSLGRRRRPARFGALTSTEAMEATRSRTRELAGTWPSTYGAPAVAGNSRADRRGGTRRHVPR